MRVQTNRQAISSSSSSSNPRLRMTIRHPLETVKDSDRVTDPKRGPTPTLDHLAMQHSMLGGAVVSRAAEQTSPITSITADSRAHQTQLHSQKQMRCMQCSRSSNKADQGQSRLLYHMLNRDKPHIATTIAVETLAIDRIGILVHSKPLAEVLMPTTVRQSAPRMRHSVPQTPCLLICSRQKQFEPCCSQLLWPAIPDFVCSIVQARMYHVARDVQLDKAHVLARASFLIAVCTQ